MLSWLFTRLRSYGAITLVGLYAVGVIMPPVASTIPSRNAPSHCLTDHLRGVSEAWLQSGIDVHDSIHVPGDGTMDKSAYNSMESGYGKLKCHAGACCGLFCCAAITGDFGATVVPVHASLFFGAPDESPDGRGPKRIGRPPKSFVSL